MRTSRIFRLILRVFLLLLASSMSSVSFLGGYSALLILGDEDNIDLDINFEGDPFLDPNNFEIEIEFEINNLGYFDLEDIELELRLYLIYERLNQTNAEINTTQSIKIYDDEKSFKTIEAGQKKKITITIEPDDLKSVNFIDINNTFNPFRDPIMEFEAAEIVIRAKYSLGLLSFKVKIEDYNLGEFEV